MTDLLGKAEIKQLNLGYDPEQDRLLLKVGLSNNKEVTVWLTRRLVKSLWLLLQNDAGMEEVEAQEMVMVEHQLIQDSIPIPQVKQNLDLDKQPNTEALVDEPMLANSCLIARTDEMQSVLEIKSKDGKMIKVVLNLELMLALSSMLQLATKEAVWDLSFSASHFIFPETSARPVLH